MIYLARSFDEIRAAKLPLALVVTLPEASERLASVSLTLSETDTFAAITHDGQRQERMARRRLLRWLLQQAGFGDAALSRGTNGNLVMESAPVFVSASSRNGVIAAAIAAQPIGIDVEASGDGTAILPLLHPYEQAHINAGCDPARLWCAKEAVWKARTMPLSRDAASFMVLPDADGRFTVEGTEGRVCFDAALQVYIAHAIATS